MTDNCDCNSTVLKLTSDDVSKDSNAGLPSLESLVGKRGNTLAEREAQVAKLKQELCKYGVRAEEASVKDTLGPCRNCSHSPIPDARQEFFDFFENLKPATQPAPTLVSEEKETDALDEVKEVATVEQTEVTTENHTPDEVKEVTTVEQTEVTTENHTPDEVESEVTTVEQTEVTTENHTPDEVKEVKTEEKKEPESIVETVEKKESSIEDRVVELRQLAAKSGSGVKIEEVNEDEMYTDPKTKVSVFPPSTPDSRAMQAGDFVPVEDGSYLKIELTPVKNLPRGVIVVMEGSDNGGTPHGTLLLAEYRTVGNDPIAFFRKCKESEIGAVVSFGKQEAPFAKKVNDYLKSKNFKNVEEMDVPRLIHGKLDLKVNGERDVIRAAGDFVCTHMDVGCNVLILSDAQQAGRVVACYSYAWTKCASSLEELKVPLQAYVKAGGDKKMFATIQPYDFLRKYGLAYDWYLRWRMEEMQKRNGGHIPSIEGLAKKPTLEEVVNQGPAPPGTMVLDPEVEEIAAKVRAKAAETGLDTKEIIEKHVQKYQNRFIWVN